MAWRCIRDDFLYLRKKTRDLWLAMLDTAEDLGMMRGDGLPGGGRLCKVGIDKYLNVYSDIEKQLCFRHVGQDLFRAITECQFLSADEALARLEVKARSIEGMRLEVSP